MVSERYAHDVASHKEKENAQAVDAKYNALVPRARPAVGTRTCQAATGNLRHAAAVLPSSCRAIRRPRLPGQVAA